MKPQFSKTAPVQFARSNRGDNFRNLTSAQPGLVIPLAYVPVLREDSVNGVAEFNFGMMETAEQIMNGVSVEVRADFVSHLALDRFDGLDMLDKSYAGEPGAPAYFETEAFGDQEIYRALGLHAKPTDTINTNIKESYNQIVNHMRRERSPSLTERALTDGTLATGFWRHNFAQHIVPTFDQALLDGEVALNVTSASLPIASATFEVDGVAYDNAATPASVLQYSGNTNPATLNPSNLVGSGSAANVPTVTIHDLTAELASQGVVLSLSNLEMAKKTAAFARLRQSYQGLSDDYLINLLMQGISIPLQQLKQPLMLGSDTTMFGYTSRYASDAANLDKSVTTGETRLRIPVRLPRSGVGGLIMFTAQIMPEQLFERRKDYYIYATSTDDLPNALRDELDPEKVSVVANSHVDVDHTDPDTTFGYAPLNHEWQRTDRVNIGGKYYRPDVDAAFDEDRQKIWAVETVDPTLTEDFYLATQMHTKVFKDTISDAFEIMSSGAFVLNGNTVFGAALTEATDDYDVIDGQIDKTRLAPPA